MPFRPLTPKEKEKENTWIKKQCRHPEHNPPGMIVLPPGMHIWVCPSCGVEQTIIIPEKTC